MKCSDVLLLALAFAALLSAALAFAVWCGLAADEDARLALFWVFKGLKVFEEDTGLTYICNVAGATQGESPWTLDTDWSLWMPDPGADGSDGSIWYRGGGDPQANVGVNTDLWLQTAAL